jgi:hypothetical protein
MFVLNFRSEKYNQSSRQFINPRTKSSCAFSNSGDVFIAGGFGRGWGLESWNPEKNTVVSVTERLPSEEGQSGLHMIDDNPM